MTGLRIWLLIAIVLGGGALLACKSSNKSATPTATRTTATNGTTESGTTPAATGGGANAALTALEGKAATKEVKAAYDFTSTAAGTTTTASFTIYSKPPDSRFDVVEGGVTSTILTTGGKTYICSADTGSCYESPTQIPLPFLSFFTDPTSLSSMIGANLSDANINRSSKTVAGQSADCFAVAGGAAGAVGTGEVCFSSDGVLLSITANSAGTVFTLAATSVTGTVSAADLTLPYPVLGAP
jgi:hypothetical protein